MDQLERTLPFLATLPVQVIYSSPLKRAKIVAQRVSRATGLPMFEDREGKVAQTLAIEEPELFSLWKSNP